MRFKKLNEAYMRDSEADWALDNKLVRTDLYTKVYGGKLSPVFKSEIDGRLFAIDLDPSSDEYVYVGTFPEYCEKITPEITQRIVAQRQFESFDEDMKFKKLLETFSYGEEDGLFTIYLDGQIHQQYSSIEKAEDDGWIFEPTEGSLFFDEIDGKINPKEEVLLPSLKFIYDNIPNQNKNYTTYFWDVYKNNGNKTKKINRLSIYIKSDIKYPYKENTNDKTVVSFAYNADPPFLQVPTKDYIKHPKEYDLKVLKTLDHLVESLNEDYSEDKLKKLISVQHVISPKDDIQLFTTQKGNYLVKRNGKKMMILDKKNFGQSDIENLRLNGYFHDYDEMRINEGMSRLELMKQNKNAMLI